MMWQGWPFERVVLLFTALALLMITVQVYIFHSRQNFRHPAMWLPILGAPAIAVFLILLVIDNVFLARALAGLFLIIGIIFGLIGSFYHIRGIGERVDGYRMENILVGPPLILPIMISALSILGLLALYWR